MKAHVRGEAWVECDEFEEGKYGLLLRDRSGNVVGYVPYENLEYVAHTRTPVVSSSVRSVGYEPDERVLEIEFQSDGVYRYDDVPSGVYRGLLRARSHGSYFHDEIRGQYDYQRIR